MQRNNSRNPFPPTPPPFLLFYPFYPNFIATWQQRRQHGLWKDDLRREWSADGGFYPIFFSHPFLPIFLSLPFVPKFIFSTHYPNSVFRHHDGRSGTMEPTEWIKGAETGSSHAHEGIAQVTRNQRLPARRRPGDVSLH